MNRFYCFKIVLLILVAKLYAFSLNGKLDYPPKTSGSSNSTLITFGKCLVNEDTLVRIFRLLEAARDAAHIPTQSFQASTLRNDCGGPLPAYLLMDQGQRSDECEEVLKHVDDLIGSIAWEVELLISAVILDPTQYQMMIAALQAKINNLVKTLDNMEIAHEANLEKLYERIRQSRDCFLDLLQKKIYEVEKIKLRYETKLAELIAAQIMLSDFGPAEANINLLNNDNYLPSIVDMVYEEKCFQQLAGLMIILPMHSQRASVLLRWFQNMETRGHLTSGNIIIIRKMLKDEAASMGSDFSSELKTIMSKVDSSTDTVTSAWASQIQNSNYSDIVEFGSPKVRSVIGPCFDDVLTDIVSKASSSFVQCVDFVLALNWNLHRYTGVARLLSLTVSSPQYKLRVGFAIKNVLDNLNGPDNPDSVRQKLLNLKASLDHNLRCVVWHKTIYLKNAYHREYLYGVESQYEFNANNRRVVTWKPGSLVYNAKFEFIPDINNREITFFIRNIDWNEYLGRHTQNANYDGDRGYVSLQNYRDQWVVQFEKGTDILLIHLRSNKYFYASSFDFMENRRYPFLWLKGGVTAESGWTVTCE